MRNFEIGDRVEFEVIYLCSEWRPRWNCGYDDINKHDGSKGPTRQGIGEVTRVDYKNAKNMTVKMSSREWQWPLPGRSDAHYGQPGYVKHLETESLLSTEENKCTCSSIDLFNYGCRCGGK